MKQLNQWFKRKKIQIMAALITFFFIYTPKLAYADARGDAQTKLKNEFSGAINGFTNVFQFLCYGVAVLALIIVGLSGMILNDEQAIKTTKHRSTWVVVIAIAVGLASTLITIATNKTS